MTSYEVIFNRFLSKIEDADLPRTNDDDRQMMMQNWLHSAIGYIELDHLRIKNELVANDDMEAFTENLYDSEIEVLALYMVVAWYDDKVNSLDHTLLFLGTKDEKWTNQRDHWKVTREMQESYRKRARKYFRDHSARDNWYIYPEYEAS
ncbi:MAG: hypothetical protein MJZ16_12805, partial [Bacteroidales bacterium]|nr:hypothetical protein [Bacteroidales bacterium]